MSVRPSEAEAILLAKRVASDAADRAEIYRSDGLYRFAPIVLWVIGAFVYVGYGRELASHFELSRPAFALVLLLVGLWTHMTIEIAILQRKVASLCRLLQSANRNS